MIHLIGQLIMGLIVGVIARLVLPGKEPIAAGALGWLITALLGVAGALIGTLIGSALWGGEGYAAGWIMSIIGAVLLLLLARLLLGDRSVT
jgi:uncharacterized membrane protein YeaQ/YmgE (transglycosylase-associated protein family)